MTARSDLPTAVVMGLSPTGLHVARTLDRLGARVVGIGRPGETGLSSRVVSQRIIDDGNGDPLDRVVRADNELPVLMPTSDEYVQHVSRADRSDFQFQRSFVSGSADLLSPRMWDARPVKRRGWADYESGHMRPAVVEPSGPASDMPRGFLQSKQHPDCWMRLVRLASRCEY